MQEKRFLKVTFLVRLIGKTWQYSTYVSLTLKKKKNIRARIFRKISAAKGASDSVIHGHLETTAREKKTFWFG